MPQMLDIGPRAIAEAKAVSSISYNPPFDREALLTRILITNPSASDNWTVNVGGREIMRIPANILNQNNLAGNTSLFFPRAKDLFSWYKMVTGDYLSIPVPRGLNVTVSSVGGATANVTLVGMDLTPGSLSPAMVNHYQGNHFIIPYTAFLAAAVTAAGEVAVDSLIKPSWVGSMFLKTNFPVAWRANILAMWLESVSVNTFSGSANHVSSTDHVAIIRNGERLFTHVQPGQVSGGQSSVTTVPAGNLVAPGGIPLNPTAAAAGSANTVFGSNTSIYPAFQTMTANEQPVLDPPLLVQGGDETELYLGITGDVTGGASYANAYMCFLVDIMQVG